MKYSVLSVSSVKLSSETNQAYQARSQTISTLKKLIKNKGSMVSMLPLLLAACGGSDAASLAPATPAAPAPAPELGPDYTESPTGTFTGRDSANLTLAQGTATTDLIVNSKGGNDTITTGSGNDIIDGSAGNDSISTGDGADTITAGDGADIIWGGLGADTIDAGAGDDIIVVIGTTGASDYTEASITSPAGSGIDLSSMLALENVNAQTVSEIEAGETIDGGTGADTLIIYGTVDLTGVTLTNLTTLQVNSTMTLTPAQLAQFTTVNGDGSSVLNIVNDGSDALVIDLANTSYTNIATLNTTGNVKIIVSSIDDVAGITDLVTDSEITLVLADDGTGTNSIQLSELAAVFGTVAAIEVDPSVTLVFDDTASIANTTITTIGSDGVSELDDILYGTSGRDFFNGGVGNDTVYGLAGDDILESSPGEDIYYGGDGRDQLKLGSPTGDGDDIYTGGAGSDLYLVYPNSGNDIITDFDLTEDRLSLQRVDGIESDIVGTDTAEGALFELGGGNSLLIQGHALSDVLNAGGLMLPEVMGTSGDDVLILEDSQYTVYVSGGRGNDTITTGVVTSGFTRVFGGAGDDVITGGDSWDFINGGTGSDILDGGNGPDRDILRYYYDLEGITADLSAGIVTNASGDSDTVSNFEEINATDFDDVIIAGGGANPDMYRISAGGGNDTVTVISGQVLVYGRSGDDMITTADGDDNIYAGSGNDTIDSGAGFDYMDGGEGDDTLTGGTGADIFSFDGNWGNDTISDFEDGSDQLELWQSGLTFDDLTITQSGDDTLVEYGLSNSITLTGIASTDITADDFIF